MTNNHTACVIIVTHNRSSLLEKAVKSSFNQTKKPLQIIVVDDCSNIKQQDNNKKIASKYAIEYYCLEKNSGPQVARNYGASKAIASILLFLDDDDQFKEDKIEKIIKCFNNIQDLGAVSNGFKAIWKNDKSKNFKTKLHDDIDSMLKDNSMGGCSVMSVKKDIFMKIGGFSTNLLSCQDWDFWLKLYKNTKIKVLQDPLTIYTLIDSKRISKNLRKIYQGNKSFYLKYKKDMRHETKMWMLYKIFVHKYFLIKNSTKLTKIILLSLKSRKFMPALIIFLSLIKNNLNKHF